MKIAFLLLTIIFALSCSSTVNVKGEMFVTSKTGESLKFGGKSVQVFTSANDSSPLTETTTDANGQFSVKLPTGDYRFKATAPDPSTANTPYKMQWSWNVPVKVQADTKTVSLGPDTAILKPIE